MLANQYLECGGFQSIPDSTTIKLTVVKKYLSRAVQLLSQGCHSIKEPFVEAMKFIGAANAKEPRIASVQRIEKEGNDMQNSLQTYLLCLDCCAIIASSCIFPANSRMR